MRSLQKRIILKTETLERAIRLEKSAKNRLMKIPLLLPRIQFVFIKAFKKTVDFNLILLLSRKGIGKLHMKESKVEGLQN